MPMTKDTLHAALVLSKQARATLKSVDATAARAMPGVAAALFAEVSDSYFLVVKRPTPYAPCHL